MSRRFEVARLPAALAVALTALLAVQLLYRPAEVETTIGGVAPRLLPLPAVAPLPASDAIEARPLFVPTRSAVAAGPVADGATATIDGVTLVGVASRGRRAMAVLRGSDNVVRSLGPGQPLFGWTVETIHADAVVVARGGERRTIAIGAAAAPGPGQ